MKLPCLAIWTHGLPGFLITASSLHPQELVEVRSRKVDSVWELRTNNRFLLKIFPCHRLEYFLGQICLFLVRPWNLLHSNGGSAHCLYFFTAFMPRCFESDGRDCNLASLMIGSLKLNKIYTVIGKFSRGCLQVWTSSAEDRAAQHQSKRQAERGSEAW